MMREWHPTVIISALTELTVIQRLLMRRRAAGHSSSVLQAATTKAMASSGIPLVLAAMAGAGPDSAIGGADTDPVPYLDTEVRSDVANSCRRMTPTAAQADTACRSFSCACMFSRCVPSPHGARQYDDPAMREYVDGLVVEEMGTFVPRDYLKDLPAPPAPTFGGSAMLRAEYERVAAGAERAPESAKLDTSRYELPMPVPGASLTAWTEALQNAKAQLENTTSRVTNLELMQQFGSNAWRVHNADVGALAKRLRLQLEKLRNNIEEVNAARKTRLEPQGVKLRQLQRKWEETVDTNLRIEVACADLEHRVKRLRSEAEHRGLLAPNDGGPGAGAAGVGVGVGTGAGASGGDAAGAGDS